MNKKLSLILGLGVIFVFLAGGCFVGYKLWKRQKNRALAAELQRWEVKVPLKVEGNMSVVQLEQHVATQNEKLDRYDVLRPVVDELDLVRVWGVPDADAAMIQLKASSDFRIGDEPGSIIFVVSDKDKALAGKLRQAVGRSFDDMLRRESFMPPPPPPGYKE